MQSRIYSRLFNLKDRQDLPANNPAIPAPQANAYVGDENRVAPVEAAPPHTAPVPKPPKTALPTSADPGWGGGAPPMDEDEQRMLRDLDAQVGEMTKIGQASKAGRAYVPVDPRADTAPAETPSQGIATLGAPIAGSEDDARAVANRAGLKADTRATSLDNSIAGASEYRRSQDLGAASDAEKAKVLEEQAAKALKGPDVAKPVEGLFEYPFPNPINDDQRKANAKAEKQYSKQNTRENEDRDYNERLKAEMPYENPKTAAEKAENRRAELRFKADNPRNEDRGVKGFIRETLQNFLFGLSKAQGVPGISIPQALMLGGVGAGGGMINRSWNEQRQAESELGGATEELTYQTGLEDKRRGMDARDASIGIRDRAEQRQTEKNLVDADYKMKSLGIQEKYRNEYLELLRSRDVYNNADKKEKANQAQQRINLLEKKYKLDERKAGVAIGKSVIDTMDKQQAALKKIDARLKEAESAGDTEQIAKLKAARAQAEAYKFNQ